MYKLILAHTTSCCRESEVLKGTFSDYVGRAARQSKYPAKISEFCAYIMQLNDAISLITKGVTAAGAPQTWADLGSGRGLFTWALFSILPKGSELHAVDIEQQDFHDYPSSVTFHRSDFSTGQITLPPLDGIIMANSLHYIKDQAACIHRLKNYLGDRGRIILIDYDMERPNDWVPFPISFLRAQELFRAAGYSMIMKIGEQQSVYRKENIYSALIS